jgi:hypothetical protein
MVMLTEENPQWEPLASTDGRTIRVDSTGARFVEERTSALRMRGCSGEPVAVTLSNEFRLDGGHSQIVETTSIAAPPALQPVAVTLRQSSRLAIDVSMECNQRPEHRSPRLTRRHRTCPSEPPALAPRSTHPSITLHRSP